ncbi:MAG: helix-turn-helix transcriptional regulator [Fidelibacterota bacterium]|nr:MAG: helix-turn-helix transcriptional regulator [Candidatus Neomarinimicrobiota bacterium]
MMPFTWQFGERVRRIRKMAKLTQEEFGQTLSVSRQTVNAYENDRQRPPLDMMEKMCREQGISPRWLLTGLGDPKADIAYAATGEGGGIALTISEESLAPEQLALVNFITEDRGRAVRLTRFLMGEGLKNLPAGGSAEILGNP